MLVTRQVDEYVPTGGGHRQCGGYPASSPVGRRSAGDGQWVVTGSDRDQHRSDERFVRETEQVREFLVRNAVRLTYQRADAEDLVQETLLKAYVSFDSYREGTQLKSWLSRIMANAWIDKHRSSQRRPAEKLSAEMESRSSLDVFHAGSVESAEAQALQSIPSEAELALQTLPDGVREIVYYACIAQYRNTEIAALLDIPVGTVGSRLHRGKALLRDALAVPDPHCSAQQ